MYELIHRLASLFHAPRVAIERAFDRNEQQYYPYKKRHSHGGRCWECGCATAEDENRCEDCLIEQSW